MIIKTKYNQVIDFYTEINLNPEILVNSFLERLNNFWSSTCPYYHSSFEINLEHQNLKLLIKKHIAKYVQWNLQMIIESALITIIPFAMIIIYQHYICSRCNLKVVCQKELKVISHKSSYDMNFFIKYSSSNYPCKILSQKSNVKFYNISAKNLYFIDSYQFLKSSLTKLILQANKDEK